jgi:hypothetical protein
LEEQFEKDMKVFCENLGGKVKVIEHYGGGWIVKERSLQSFS